MIFNLLTDLTDPDNIPDGYGGLDISKDDIIIFSILLIIILVQFFIILFLVFKLDKYKRHNNTENSDLKQTDLSEEEKQTITEFRKLTAQEQQVINDTIKTFNSPKSN